MPDVYSPAGVDMPNISTPSDQSFFPNVSPAGSDVLWSPTDPLKGATTSPSSMNPVARTIYADPQPPISNPPSGILDTVSNKP